MRGDQTINPLDFGSLLSSRICHDLISPAAAIVNGLELLEEIEDESERQATLELIRQSAEQSSAKLQFLRIAFGACGAMDSEFSPDMVRKVLEKYMEGERAELEWEVSIGSMEKGKAKLLLNVILMAIRCIPRGGVIKVRMGLANGVDRMEVDARGENPRIPDDIEEAIVKGNHDVRDAKSIQPLYSTILADSCGMAIGVESATESISFFAESRNGLSNSPQ